MARKLNKIATPQNAAGGAGNEHPENHNEERHQRSPTSSCFVNADRPRRTRHTSISEDGSAEFDSNIHNRSGGAVPRSPGYENVDFRRIRGNRRRLDNFNLNPPRLSGSRNTYGEFVEDDMGARSAQPREDVVVEGQELYLHFLHEQLRSQNLDEAVRKEEERLTSYHDSSAHLSQNYYQDEPHYFRMRRSSMNLQNFQNPLWRRTGQKLKVLADEFAKSQDRRRVRESAESVDIFNLNMKKFFVLLVELFRDGRITKERILVLFFFCSDVAICALKAKAKGWLASLTRWTLRFIKEKVCTWVDNNGGWAQVLMSGMDFLQHTAQVGACVGVILCCAIYIRKSLLGI